MKNLKKSAAGQVQPEDRIAFSQLAAYGAGGIIPIALFNIAGILVGLMGNISLGLSAFWLGFILIIPRLWDALSDPIIGHLSDNTRSRWGRRRPYLLLGGILVAVMFVVMWWIPKGDLVRSWFPSESGFQAFQLVYILITLLLFFTAVNIFEIPHGALGMELTTDYHLRTRLFSAKSFVGNLFAMSTPWLFKLASMDVFKGPGGNEADGMRYVSLMIAAIIIPLSVWMFIRLKEPGFVKAAKHEKTPFWKDMKLVVTNKNFVLLTLTVFTLAMGFNFVQLLGSYIPIFYVFGGDKAAGATLLGINGTVWAITGVLAVFPLNWISPRLGKRNTLTVAMVLMILAQLSKILCYNPSHPFLIIIPTVLLSAGMLFFFTLGSSMVGDICDEDELNKGYRSEGSYYAIFWWFIKLGTALASFVAGALIVLTMFDETQVTKVDSVQGGVRELRAKVQSWQDYKGPGSAGETRIAYAKTEIAAALKESQDYVKYLENESQKAPGRKNQLLPEAAAQRKTMMTDGMAVAKNTVAGLENLQQQLNSTDIISQAAVTDSLLRESIRMTIQTRYEKVKLHAFELLSHLQAKAAKDESSIEHYKTIIQNSLSVYNSISGLDLGTAPELLNQQIGSIENQILPLTKQTPYTLLMMRIVEIGLPVLLSLLSIFFAFRYSLTEKRSHEIKALLKQRDNGQSGGNRSVEPALN